jgi:hypothetical protein
VVAGDSISSEASVPLEIEERPRTVGSEYAVDPAGVKPKTPQP